MLNNLLDEVAFLAVVLFAPACADGIVVIDFNGDLTRVRFSSLVAADDDVLGVEGFKGEWMRFLLLAAADEFDTADKTGEEFSFMLLDSLCWAEVTKHVTEDLKNN